MRVVGDHEDAIAENRHAAIDSAGGITRKPFTARPPEVPDLPTSARVKGVRFVDGRDIHDAVHYQ